MISAYFYEKIARVKSLPGRRRYAEERFEYVVVTIVIVNAIVFCGHGSRGHRTTAMTDRVHRGHRYLRNRFRDHDIRHIREIR
jgi:hypothetical protein